MNKKEQTPLVVHETLEPYLDKGDSLFVKINSEDDLIRFKGIAPDSIFYFHIKGHRRNKSNKNEINVEYQPSNKESVESRELWLEPKNIDGHFKLWYNLLEGYNNTRTVFDDPIVDSFQEDYFSYFEIIDEEKDKPLESNAILPLYEHFELISSRLEEYKNESNQTEIQEIQEDIAQLNANLTKEGRQIVAKRICRIWAKLTKQGVKYVKEFVEVSRKYVMKEAVKQIFQLGKKGAEYIEDLTNLLS